MTLKVILASSLDLSLSVSWLAARDGPLSHAVTAKDGAIPVTIFPAMVNCNLSETVCPNQPFFPLNSFMENSVSTKRKVTEAGGNGCGYYYCVRELEASLEILLLGKNNEKIEHRVA